MINVEELARLPLWEEILGQIKYECTQFQRPADQVILDDADVCRMLKVSRRTTATLRSTGQITYYKCGKILYKLSDVLEYLEHNKVTAEVVHGVER